MICIWSSWCHCHPPSSLAPVKSRIVYRSGASLARFCWKKGHYTDVVFVHLVCIISLTLKMNLLYISDSQDSVVAVCLHFTPSTAFAFFEKCILWCCFILCECIFVAEHVVLIYFFYTKPVSFVIKEVTRLLWFSCSCWYFNFDWEMFCLHARLSWGVFIFSLSYSLCLFGYARIICRLSTDNRLTDANPVS